MLQTAQHFVGLTRSAGFPHVWMAERAKVSGRAKMMEEAKHPGTGCGCLLCYWCSPQHTEAGCWAATDCSPSLPPETDQSEIDRNAALNDNPSKTKSHKPVGWWMTL